jgi:hypothetical protein
VTIKKNSQYTRLSQTARIYKDILHKPFFLVNIPNEVQQLMNVRLRGHADVFRVLNDEQFTVGTCEQDAKTKDLIQSGPQD